MEERTLVCTICPGECELKAKLENDVITDLSGNRCSRGKNFAEMEIKQPQRILTTSVIISNGEISLLPVKSKKPVDKHLMLKCIEVLKNIEVEAPVKMGEVILENILDTGVDVIASRSVNRKIDGKK